VVNQCLRWVMSEFVPNVNKLNFLF
jgi:hypothetical protein